MISSLVLKEVLSKKIFYAGNLLSSILRKEGEDISHVPFFSRKFGLYTENQKKEAIK
jgi:hypothetical protein